MRTASASGKRPWAAQQQGMEDTSAVISGKLSGLIVFTEWWQTHCSNFFWASMLSAMVFVTDYLFVTEHHCVIVSMYLLSQLIEWRIARERNANVTAEPVSLWMFFKISTQGASKKKKKIQNGLHVACSFTSHCSFPLLTDVRQVEMSEVYVAHGRWQGDFPSGEYGNFQYFIPVPCKFHSFHEVQYVLFKQGSAFAYLYNWWR